MLQQPTYLPHLERCRFLFDRREFGLIERAQTLMKIRPSIVRNAKLLDLSPEYDDELDAPLAYTALAYFDCMTSLNLMVMKMQQFEVIVSVLSPQSLPLLTHFELMIAISSNDEGVPIESLDKMLVRFVLSFD